MTKIMTDWRRRLFQPEMLSLDRHTDYLYINY